jgi:hypothetical protein
MRSLFSAVDPLNVGGAKRASELASAVGERLLLMHMKGADERTHAREIADNLNKSFYSHGDALSRSQAERLRLKVAKNDPKLDQLIWDAYVGIEAHMELRVPFNPMEVLLGDPDAAATLRPPGPLNLPANCPAEIAQQVWQAAVNQSMQGLSQPQKEIPYKVVNALVESSRLASECSTEGTISGIRLATGQVRISVTDTKSGWKRLDLAEKKEETAPGT